jgi:tetratricopeptide (TPR) repeat protein
MIPKRLRQWILSAALAAVAGLASCWSPQKSLSPLHTDKDVVLDDTIVGTWNVDEGDTNYRPPYKIGEWRFNDARAAFARSPAKDAKSYDLTRSAGARISLLSTVHLLRLKNYLFINLSPRLLNPPQPGSKLAYPTLGVNAFGRIAITRNVLFVRMMPEHAISALESQGQLPLERAGPGPVLVSPTEKLQKFALEHAEDPQVFPLNVTLCREGTDCGIEVPLAAINTEPQEVKWYLSLAIAYMDRDRFDDAWAAWKHFSASKPPLEGKGEADIGKGVEYYLSLAESFMDWGYAGSGISVLKTCAANQSDSDLAWAVLGYGYLHLNRPRDAMTAFHKAAILEAAKPPPPAPPAPPSPPSPATGLASPSTSTSPTQTAISRPEVKAQPPAAVAPTVEELEALSYAVAYIEMGEFEKARIEARKCPPNTSPCKGETQVALLTYFAEGNYDAVFQMMAGKPSHTEGLLAYLLLRHLGKSEDARKVLDSLAKSGIANSAMPVLEEPVELTSVPGSDRYLRGALSDSQYLAGIHPAKGRVVVPELCVAYCLIGERHLLDGDRAGARKYYRKAVDTHAYTYALWIIANARLKQMPAK